MPAESPIRYSLSIFFFKPQSFIIDAGHHAPETTPGSENEKERKPILNDITIMGKACDPVKLRRVYVRLTKRPTDPMNVAASISRVGFTSRRNISALVNVPGNEKEER
jgi:hypothetical protein